MGSTGDSPTWVGSDGEQRTQEVTWTSHTFEDPLKMAIAL